MSKNYEKALQLLNNKIACKHYTYDKAKDKYIVLDLGGEYCGYIHQDMETVEVTRNNSVVWYGNITDDLQSVKCTRNTKVLPIIPWQD